MNTELSAQVTLVVYALVALAAIVWQAHRSALSPLTWLFYAINRTFINLAFHWRANSRNPLPTEGAAILIANHTSPLDPMLLWNNHHFGSEQTRLRTYHFVMLKEHYYQRGVSWICKGMQAIPLDSEKGNIAIREALRQLQRGHIIGIFPEGGINREPGIAPGNPGVAFLAIKSKVPVYPVYIHNSPGGRNLIEPFYSFCRVRLTYGEPIDLSNYYNDKISREHLMEVTELLMDRLAELGKTFVQSDASHDGDSTQNRIAGKIDGSIAS